MMKASILIPVYNRESMIKTAVDSALNQSYKNIEVVICDNMSTDNTWEALKTIATTDHRIRIFRNDSNLGPVNNWKRCAELATGEYASLLFSDDHYFPDFIESAIEPLSDPSIGFVSCQVLIGKSSETGKLFFNTLPDGINPRERYLNALFSEIVPSKVSVSPGNALFRTKDLVASLSCSWPDPHQIGFMSHGAGPDLWTYLHALSTHSNFYQVNKPLVKFTSHDLNLSLKPLVPLAYSVSMERFFREFDGEEKKRLSHVFWTTHFYKVLTNFGRSPIVMEILKNIPVMQLSPALLSEFVYGAIKRRLMPSRTIA